jgi:hypothetical protein
LQQRVEAAVVTALRILAAGVDSLYVSVKGEVWDGLPLVLRRMVEMAEGETVPCTFREGGPDFLLRSHGWRGYPFWVTSPRFELYLGAAAPFPPAYVQLHSPYLHTLGAEDAAAEVEEFLATDVFHGQMEIAASRVDVYADVQGWEPRYDDFLRFACRGVRRRMYEVAGQLHASGRRLSGFVFGAGDVLARVYDKTLQMQATGQTWQETVWSGRDPERPVWRVEFQFRREALASFGVRTVGDVLGARQGLWEYGTRWLSLRQPTNHTRRARWPEALVWQDLRAAQIGSPRSDLVRECIRAADEQRLVRGFVGYATSLAAMGSARDLEVTGVLARDVPAARRYLAKRGIRFGEIVEDKRRHRLELPERRRPGAA